MTADAYATAFMVMGLEASLKLVNENSGLEAYFIYTDSTGNLKNEWTSGLNELIEEP